MPKHKLKSASQIGQELIRNTTDPEGVLAAHADQLARAGRLEGVKAYFARAEKALPAAEAKRARRAAKRLGHA